MTTTENTPTDYLVTNSTQGLLANVQGFGFYEAKAERVATWTVAAAVARMVDVYEGERNGDEQVAAIRALADSNELGALAVRIMAADISPDGYTY